MPSFLPTLLRLRLGPCALLLAAGVVLPAQAADRHRPSPQPQVPTGYGTVWQWHHGQPTTGRMPSGITNHASPPSSGRRGRTFLVGLSFGFHGLDGIDCLFVTANGTKLFGLPLNGRPESQQLARAGGVLGQVDRLTAILARQAIPPDLAALGGLPAR